METILEIVDNVIAYVLRPVCKQVGYIVHYKQNVHELNGSCDHLGCEKERLEHHVDEAHKNLQNIEGKVTKWLLEVSEFESEFEKFKNDEGHTKVRFPHLWNRHRLGRRAKKMTMLVKNLVNESPKFDEVAYKENVTSNVVTLSNVGYMEFGSRNSTMNDILARLQDSTVKMIGLHGPGGVGKTTFVKEIAKKARNKKLFDVVARVEITVNPNLQKIQEDIAYVLGLRLERDGENIRADCLRRRLKKEKENTLIILDDLWDKLDLNKLGIPLDDALDDENDDYYSKMNKSEERNNDYQDPKHKVMKKEKPPNEYKGCKILLTSRDKNVLSDKMEVKSIFCIKELDDDDALMLFQKVVGTSNEMSKFKQEIVKKYCEGIPMAIITVGRALRNKSESVWEARLEKLKKQELVGVQKPMEISLKMNYDHLENEELKSIFLLCAQMGHQPQIMDLVKYSFGLGILEGVYSLTEARERVHTLIQKLVDSNLVVLDGSSSDHFNMHDMVRDAALSIAHKEKNVFTMRNGKVDDWLELEQCTSISICNSDIIDELPNAIYCPQLKFFRIDSDGPFLEIHEHFFEGMKNLRVLVLSGFHLSNIKNLFKYLSNLRMLCLERCILDANLSIIGELKKIRIISFSGSQIQNFPAELGCLDRLQSLDISNCYIESMYLPFISKLTSLEELYIRKSSINFVMVGETSKGKTKGQKSFLFELKNLHQLKVVDLSVSCAAFFPKELFFNNLHDYKIVIGDIKVLSGGDFRMPNKYEPVRSLALQLETDNIHSLKGIKLLFKTVQNLLLGEINGVKNDIYELNLDGFPDLKHLSITNNFSIEYLFNSMGLTPPVDVFSNLESLCLYKLWNIKMICSGPVPDASFTKLKTIKIKMCAHLKNIISSYMVKFLSSLEKIDVSDCDSIEEIVEIPEKSNKVEFPKLHYLTLQSLPPSFASFYSRVKENIAPPLFGELVNIPNLESLNLSSINIHKIWCNQSLSSFCFQNLIKLVVKDCNKLRYLCSLSMASGLNMLKSLHVSGCPVMEKIFCVEGNGIDKAFVFPKLEEIHLNKMSMLINIWQVEMSVDSFCSLISVHIEKCKKLEKIFPSHIEGWYESLENLKVIDCPLMKVIFEIEDSQLRDAYGGIDTNLQSVFLNELPKLKQVWSIDPKGILNFKKLHSIDVSYCNKLRNVFPASMTKDVQKIEYMSVTCCDRMVEIVACEDELEASNEPLVFPELTNMELSYLENMKCFCVGRHAIKCPKLNKLTIMNSDKLEIFHTTSESTNKEIAVFSPAVFSTPEKVFSSLEYMKIGFKEASNWLRSDTDNYIMYRLKELIIIGRHQKIDLYQFLYRMPNLEKLSLSWLTPSANITEQQGLETVLQLKELVFWESWIDDIGFKQNPVLRRLELLSLKSCSHLIILAPSLVSLTYLTYLEVKDCGGLNNLMTSSTAKSLVQLKTMKVINCRNIKEIVIGEGDQEDNKVTEILFSKLITIELVNLQELTSFCSHKNCIFKFPSLEILIVTECFMMETFSKNLTSAPKLENIFAVEGDGEATWQWEHDLNATIQKVFNDKASFRYSEYLNLSNYPELIKQLWLRPCACRLQNKFGNLKRLEVCGCDSLPQVIPSHLLACFENLEELKVHTCSETEVIFNITDEMREQQRKTLGIIRLKRLILQYLPKLQHVWDKDPEGIIDLQVLRVMKVEECNCLRSLFPAIVAKKDLTLGLEKLKVTECNELVEIFSKGAEEKEEATKKLVLSCLRSLTLRELPRLKYLYGGVERGECDGEEQLLIQIQKEVIEIPSLNKLSLDIGDVQVTRDRELLLFKSGKDFEDLLDSSAPLSHMFPNIQKFAFARCGFEEMFSAERPIYADYTLGLLLNIKGLVIYDMRDLKSIGLEQSWLQPFPQNLQKLQVIKCWKLTKLVPSGCTVYFSNLTHLKVSRCRRLLYLFTSSTAKSLGRLKKLRITECGSLKEIVSAENESDDGDKEIIFEQLQVLYLKELDELSCFYFGNWSLHFPCLEEVYLIDCNRMKSFSRHNRIDNSTEYECYTEEDGTPQQCSSDLNSTVQRILEEKLSMSKHLTIGGVNELEIIQGNILHSLELLTFLDFDEFPYEFLKQMPNIENLEVRESRFKEIFGLENPNIDEFLSQLEGLGLDSLPNLVSIGFENMVPSIASFSNLMVLNVYSCNELLYLFTYSTTKSMGQLKRIHIASCESIKEIVVCDKEGGESNEDEIIFPHLKCLTLYRLRKLRSFYEGSVDFPSLDELKITECDIMESLCGGTTIKAEKLSNVELDILLETDLNSTLMNAFLKKTSSLDIGNKPKLQEIWLGIVSIPNTYFRNLMSLIVDGCRFLSDAVLPFHLLPLFTKLEALQVRNCDYVKTVFDVKCVKQDSKIPLKKLTLSKLPNLENVWNKDPQGLLKMQPLCEVEVDNCKRLTNVFPASVANDIEKLENLVVKHCEEFMTIVAKDDAYQRETFSYVKSLTLRDLPKFKYSDTCFIHDATTSKLEHLTLDVNELKKILHEEFLENLLPEFKVFALLFQHKSDEFVQQVSDVEKLVVCDDSFKEIFCLPELKVLRWKSLRELVSVGSKNSWFESFLIGNIKSFEVISCFSSAGSLVSCTVSFSNLTYLKVNKCKGLIYLLTSSTAKSLVQLKTMEIIDCDSIEEIIVCNKEGDESTEEEIIFPHLNCLTLNGLPKLSSFYKGSLGFPMLDQLKVTNCTMLKYLLTSSTAKSLVQLEKMKIEECDSIEEIIVCNKERNESNEDEIIFGNLNSLTLDGLPKLRSFYKGRLDFPSLEQLKVTYCKKLKYLLTSSTAKSLGQLKTMDIQRCSSIIVIIACNKERHEPNEDEIIFPHLNCLTLEDLSNLRRLYKWSLSFPSLDEHNLTVRNCPWLRTHQLKSLMRKRKA